MGTFPIEKACISMAPVLTFYHGHDLISSRIRGLGQLVRARSIRTIGDLCSLSEYDVHNLPIRSPKVTTMRKVLQTYRAQHGSKVKSSAATSDDANDSNSVESDMGEFCSHTIVCPDVMITLHEV